VRCCAHERSEHRLDRDLTGQKPLTNFNIFCRSCPGTCCKTTEDELIHAFDEWGNI
jgi:hypothetical protein